DLAQVAAHLDLFPTLVDIAGLPALESQVEGRSLLPLLRDPKAPWPDRYLFTQKARWPTGSEPNQHQWKNFAVRSHQYRLVGNQLYDMLKDPGQKTDIAAENPKVVEKMRAAYDQFWKKARPLMVNETAPMSKTQPFRVHYQKQLQDSGIPDWQSPKL
ncbi:MAG: arylsulfatase, partial [Akkermansiaceae bacterium]